MINIHLHIHSDKEVLNRLNRIELAFKSLAQTVRIGSVKVQQALQELEAEVSRNTDVDESGVVLLTKLAELIESTQGDPAAVRDLAARLRASTDALAEAITAHTPADPGTTPPVEPPPA